MGEQRINEEAERMARQAMEKLESGEGLNFTKEQIENLPWWGKVMLASVVMFNKSEK